MKKCPFCKAEIEENASFCLYCMSELEEKIIIAKKNSNRILISGICILAILIGSILFFLFSDRSGENESSIPSYTETIEDNSEPNSYTSEYENETLENTENDITEYESSVAESDGESNTSYIVSNETTIDVNTETSEETIFDHSSQTSTSTNLENNESEENIIVENTSVEDSSVEDSSVEDSSVEDSSVEDSSVENTSVEDTSVEDTSVEDTSVEDTSVEDTSVKDTSVEDTSVEDTSVEDTSVEDTSVEDTSVEDTSVEDTSVEDTSVEDTSVEDSSVEDSSVEDNSAENNESESQTAQEIKYKYRNAVHGDEVNGYGISASYIENGITIIGVETVSENGVYVIPETIDGKKVIAIASNAFCEEHIKDTVKIVVVPKTVVGIKNYAFSDCYNMTDLYIQGESVAGGPDLFFPTLEKANGTITLHASKTCNDRNFNTFASVYSYYALTCGYELVWKFEEWDGLL